VQFVRVTLLSTQGSTAGTSGADFVDLSEFEIYGNPPNVLPSGAVAANPSTAAIGQEVTLAASFSDPDSAIAGYDWDVDGNGVVDRSTTEPTTRVSYATTGARSVTVFAADFRGGTGSASTPVSVSAASSAKPTVKIAASGKRSVKVTVTCDSACSLKGTLKVSKKLKRKLKLKSRTVGRLSTKLTAAGTRSFRLKLTTKTRSAMKKRKLRSLKAAAAVTATDGEKQKATARRSVKIRR
jgi:hypothetical protein